MHLLAAVTHVPGIVIGQDRVAKAGKANEISHFKPLLAPLPLAGAVITSDAMQANRDNALFVRKEKGAHWLWPILGNQPNLNAQLNALPWENAAVAAATSEISRGRIETRTVRVLPAPEGTTGFEDARQAILIERYTARTPPRGQWHTRARQAPTSPHDPDRRRRTSLDATPRKTCSPSSAGTGGWSSAHWLRDVIWNDDFLTVHTNRKRAPDLVRHRSTSSSPCSAYTE